MLVNIQYLILKEERVGNMSNKVFFGIDLSLRQSGILILNEKSEIIESKLIETNSKSDIEDRIYYINNFIFNLINKYKNDLLINIEGLSYNSKNSQKMFEIAGLHYFIRINIKKNNFRFKITPPTVLKKFITGKGNCKKNLILLEIYKKWNISFDNDNLADAYGLARIVYDNKL